MVDREMVALDLADDQQALVNTVLDKASTRFNYEEFGGAPLLGVGGNVLVGHGGSTLRAVKQMIRRAVEVVREDIPTSIASALPA
jgi:glycerol-3-phosphate acyltransferase PlsX